MRLPAAARRPHRDVRAHHGRRPTAVALAPLLPLVGTWELTGRTAGAAVDDVRGRMTGELVLGGSTLCITTSLRVGDVVAEQVELVWPDRTGRGFSAHVYSASGPPTRCHWDRRGDAIVHTSSGATFVAELRDDGRELAGSWAPDPAAATTPSAVALRRPGGPAGTVTLRRVD
jgi:hypothetical protein